MFITVRCHFSNYATTSSVAKIIFVVAEITFIVAVITYSVDKNSLFVAKFIFVGGGWDNV